MSKKLHNFFWPSYVDIMTGLFIITLVLFVISFTKYRVSETTVEKIDQVVNLDSLIDKKLFVYSAEFKRFELKERIEFERGQYTIPDSSISLLAEAGKSLFSLVNKLINRTKDYKDTIRYMVLIEGMASVTDIDTVYNAGLSYNRARSVKQLWENLGIKFDPSFCEVQVAGSGFGGLGRFPPVQKKGAFNNLDDSKNQRIILHITPKIGKLID